MILTDASVVIDHARTVTPHRRQIIVDNDATVCGVAIAEVHAGIRTPQAEARCRAALADFRTLPIPDALWEQVGSHQSLLRSNGVTVPLTDTIQATLALSLDIEIWTYDAHFGLIQRILPTLRLFREPP
jgi:predicted nucleic acid-binding protein